MCLGLLQFHLFVASLVVSVSALVGRLPGKTRP